MIFLDTNFLINYYINTNQDHERAKELMKSFKNEDKLISNLVIMEVTTVLNVRLKQDIDLISEVYEDLNNNYTILNDTGFYNKGFEILKNESNKNNKRLPLFDCVYMALMKELGIKKIATFDKHFDNQEGITKIE